MTSLVTPVAGAEAVASSPSLPCVQCKRSLAGSSCMQCQKCDFWYHIKCIGITLPIFKALAGKVPACMTIVCEDCRIAKDSSTEDIITDDGSTTRMIAMEAKLDELQVSIATIMSVISTPPVSSPLPENDPGSVRRASSSLNQGTYASVVRGQSETTKAHDFRVASDEDYHRRSVVLFGVPEEGKDLGTASEVCTIIDPSSSPREVYRLGRIKHTVPGNPGGATRPLLVSFPSNSVARSILSNSRALKDHNRFSGIYVRRSLTNAEHKYYLRLKAHCETLNGKAENANIKYIVTDTTIVRYVNCEKLANGRKGKGTPDKQFTFNPDDLNGERE